MRTCGFFRDWERIGMQETGDPGLQEEAPVFLGSSSLLLMLERSIDPDPWKSLLDTLAPDNSVLL